MTEANYKRQINAAVRGLWKGVLSFEDFNDAMKSTIARGMVQAWTQGAKECGISFDELSEEELKALDKITSDQFQYIDGFSEFIDENSKPNKGRLSDALKRGELWSNRYSEAVNQAKQMACKDKKLKWMINQRGNCSEHCPSCLSLNGKVKRGSYWEKIGIRPQSNLLACGGWRCCCGFVVTTDPISKGSLSF